MTLFDKLLLLLPVGRGGLETAGAFFTAPEELGADEGLLEVFPWAAKELLLLLDVARRVLLVLWPELWSEGTFKGAFDDSIFPLPDAVELWADDALPGSLENECDNLELPGTKDARVGKGLFSEAVPLEAKLWADEGLPEVGRLFVGAGPVLPG